MVGKSVGHGEDNQKRGPNSSWHTNTIQDVSNDRMREFWREQIQCLLQKKYPSPGRVLGDDPAKDGP